MADAGIGEAAILAAAAESAAAAGGTAATVAATLPEVVAAAAPVVAGTAAETAATAVPALALAAPEAAAIAAPEVVAPIAAAATDVPAVSGGLLAGGETAPISLLSTQSEPVTAGLLGSAAEYPLPGAGDLAGQTFAAQDIGFGAGNLGPGFGGETLPSGTGLPSTPAITTGDYAPSLLDKLGKWWETSSLGDKLSVGGKGLAGISAAQKVVAPTAGTSAGPKTTIKPGSVGQPRGGEQALAAVVEALLKRRDAYTGAAYGTPVAYRPRGLLG